ncbi:MAG: prepilin-type N-terminal cleavage/methylation domain-containing protein [Endomicrobia bacterium]|nr:prepilin-type N-terminal cleavage/methylation domain-containing protein [Endomicrobiia bacterium]
MKKQRGMTLIEVMVAMLVLSIAMIGGISFFTSAYRINYSYMESANRIDHALRYVEKVKVQRRDYPTYGAFANIGGNGFTAWFVDSEFNDDYSADPYLYENYVDGTIHIEATVNVNDGTMPFPSGNYYFSTISTSTAIDVNLISNTFTNRDYVKYRLSYAFSDAYAANQYLHIRAVEAGDYYLKYHYAPPIPEYKHGYVETSFSKMAQYARKYKYTSQYEKLPYDDTRSEYKYYASSSLSSMFPSIPSNSGTVQINNFNSFSILPNTTVIRTHSGGFDYDGSGKIDPVSITKLTSVSNGEYYFAPYRTLSDTYSGTYKSKTGSYRVHSYPGTVLKGGTLQEGTGESSSYGGVEGTAFHSRRFYKESPAAANANHESLEIISLRDNVDGPAGYTDSVKRNNDAYDADIVNTPAGIGKDSAAKFFAIVYRGNATGKEYIKTLYYWNTDSTDYESTVTGNNTPLGIAGNTGNASNTSNYLVKFIPSPGGINDQRFTRYRRSVYISMWPVNSELEGREIMKEAISGNSRIQLNDRIDYIRDRARDAGLKTIVIPFIQLYAEDEKSTLCEAL